jgi:REP element-mobilizing transposase RayT
MPFWRTYYHLIWATKQRQPIITPAIEAQLFPYLVHKATELGIHVHAVNGWTNHIHLVVSIPPRLAVAEVVKELKGASSRYINAHAPALLPPTAHFGWQDGYGVLSIGERHCHVAIEYVQRQKEHHAAQQTIARWEHSEEDDAGPQGLAPSEPAGHTRLREESAVYRTEGDLADDELPF